MLNLEAVLFSGKKNLGLLEPENIKPPVLRIFGDMTEGLNLHQHRREKFISSI
jgi:hypothetical protein